ncbi:hypothetical protein G8759_22160 [Spirosoma aureum]|uniref:Outer membrane beta-barrel protein n=1 Tax=Spirosoma aureum TaxID=2692134 RepID=A0A6G9ARL4_9BACT|nr:hypothetical protein [Spirosoma aureum]QIP15132.1 hypothetical protein G8759_22160 [Spirosoma aureum]
MKQLFCIFLFITYTSALAQNTSLYGGAGFFRLGYGNLHQIGQTLAQFTPTQPASSRNDFVYMGGEGYARLDKYILGGGGYGMAQRSISTPGFYASPFSGGGYLYLGRIVVNTRRFWLYPMAGAGMTVVGMTQRELLSSGLQESSVMLPTVNAQFGLGADWLLAAFGEGDTFGGALLGLRAGYQISPYSSGWQTTGDRIIADRPSYSTRGFFVTMTIGVGAFRYVRTKQFIH